MRGLMISDGGWASFFGQKYHGLSIFYMIALAFASSNFNPFSFSCSIICAAFFVFK
jgi:hypothetical protein